MANILKRAIEIITSERPKAITSYNLKMNGFVDYIPASGVMKSIPYTQEFDAAVKQAYNERKGVA